jgi:hypothetical protein
MPHLDNNCNVLKRMLDPKPQVLEFIFRIIGFPGYVKPDGIDYSAKKDFSTHLAGYLQRKG